MNQNLKQIHVGDFIGSNIRSQQAHWITLSHVHVHVHVLQPSDTDSDLYVHLKHCLHVVHVQGQRVWHGYSATCHTQLEL